MNNDEFNAKIVALRVLIADAYAVVESIRRCVPNGCNVTGRGAGIVAAEAKLLADAASCLRDEVAQANAVSFVLGRMYYAICRVDTTPCGGPGVCVWNADRTKFCNTSLWATVGEYDRYRHMFDYYKARPRNKSDLRGYGGTYAIFVIDVGGTVRRLTDEEIEVGRQEYVKETGKLPVPDWNGLPCGVHRQRTDEEVAFEHQHKVRNGGIDRGCE
jgi:hypothetical protein